ncbi:hypothetical protein K504DRAFT_1402 [Pleomassaria siparia CBS 279.74]|uniref:Secreted protein n=1 Tax=Pleomassaria siparia CBS 279.74 TaxID=1314801 RepID=A0A6G1KPN5_9PLEO|nr:hypothetical protein K504DRAFT_1402 [Pleomassaria siparia CBS 279.74]
MLMLMLMLLQARQLQPLSPRSRINGLTTHQHPEFKSCAPPSSKDPRGFQQVLIQRTSLSRSIKSNPAWLAVNQTCRNWRYIKLRPEKRPKCDWIIKKKKCYGASEWSVASVVQHVHIYT